MNDNTPLIVISVFAIGFTINYLIYKLIVASALKKYINPYLASHSLTLQATKFTGILDNGDFGRANFEFLLVPEMGGITQSTYIYVFALSPSNQKLRFTAKIKCRFLFIRQVLLKNSNGETIELY